MASLMASLMTSLMTSLIRYAQICEALTTARSASISESDLRSDAAAGSVADAFTAPSASATSAPVTRPAPSVVLSASQRAMASARHSGRVEERYVLEKPFGRDHSSCCEVRDDL